MMIVYIIHQLIHFCSYHINKPLKPYFKQSLFIINDSYVSVQEILSLI